MKGAYVRYSRCLKIYVRWFFQKKCSIEQISSFLLLRCEFGLVLLVVEFDQNEFTYRVIARYKDRG